MTEDHPIFPQERPAVQYIVEQVSKVQDATSCTAGYYKSVGTIISRLDKTDVELNRLNGQLKQLKEIIDFTGVSKAIKNNTEVMSLTVQNGLSENISKIDTNFMDLLKKQSVANKQLSTEIEAVSKQLERHINDFGSRINTPLWKVYMYILIAMVTGIAIGKWIT